ncbi:hypothetical protein CSC70_14335, partial [Pseudoxanthomonas kalamensis DSM 18571]
MAGDVLPAFGLRAGRGKRQAIRRCTAQRRSHLRSLCLRHAHFLPDLPTCAGADQFGDSRNHHGDR